MGGGMEEGGRGGLNEGKMAGRNLWRYFGD